MTLRQLRDDPPPPLEYTIDGVLPRGSRVTVVGPDKVGKTTLNGNLLRSVLDAEPFLGRFGADDLGDPVGTALIDTEMQPALLLHWLNDQGIQDAYDALTVYALRGCVSSFDILTDAGRAEWVDKLRGKRLLIVDCIAPVMAALGLDENSNDDVGLLINALERLVAEAGIETLVVFLHASGQDQEKPRGATRWLGWPDVKWNLIKEAERGQDNKMRLKDDGLKFFRASGRIDEDIPETMLEFDKATRLLTLGKGNRAQARLQERDRRILEAVGVRPGINTAQLEAALGVTSKGGLSKALAWLVELGHLVVEYAGAGKAKCYTLASTADFEAVED